MGWRSGSRRGGGEHRPPSALSLPRPPAAAGQRRRLPVREPHGRLPQAPDAGRVPRALHLRGQVHPDPQEAARREAAAGGVWGVAPGAPAGGASTPGGHRQVGCRLRGPQPGPALPPGPTLRTLSLWTPDSLSGVCSGCMAGTHAGLTPGAAGGAGGCVLGCGGGRQSQQARPGA